jgi:hypothetical protein
LSAAGAIDAGNELAECYGLLLVVGFHNAPRV